MSAKEYADAFAPDVLEWYPQFHVELYLHPGQRFRIQAECVEGPFGFNRFEQAADEGIDIDEVDMRDFSQEFMNTVGQKMSLHNLNIFIEELTKARDEWERDHQIYVVQNT